MAKAEKTAKKRGKPEYQPTNAKRRQVRRYAAGGISEEVIADLVGVSRNTLRKYYATELDFGHQVERAHNIDRLDKAADKGNVGAIKYLETLYGLVSAEKAANGRDAGDADEAADKAPRQVRLGKKEIADHEATSAGIGSEWGKDLLPGNVGAGKGH